MADVTPSNNTLCGFLVPWAFSDSLAADHAVGTDYNEADTKARGVTPPAGATLTLEPTGDGDSNVSAAYYVVAPRGGVPGPGLLGVGFSTTSGSGYIGASRATQVVSWEEQTTATSGLGWDSLTMGDQDIVAVSYGISGGTITYYAHNRDQSAGTWTQVTITTSPDASETIAGVALTEAPDGSLLAYYVLHRESRAYLGVSRSTDQGATWRQQNRNVCGQLDDPTIHRVRAVQLAGQIALFVEYHDGGGGSSPSIHTRQYVSVDGGLTAESVADKDGEALGDVIVAGGRIVVATQVESTDAVNVRTTGDAGSSVFDNEAVALLDARDANEHHGGAFLLQPDGVLWYYRVGASGSSPLAYRIWADRSIDFGATWQTDTPDGPIRVYDGVRSSGASGTETGLSNFDLSYSRGYILMTGCEVNQAGTISSAEVNTLYLGGGADFTPGIWSFQASPSTGILTGESRISAGDTHAALGLLANGWAANADTGSPTRLLAAGGNAGELITVGSGELATNPRTSTITNSGAMGIAYCVFRVVSGTYTFQVAIGDGSDGCDVEVSCTSTQISFVEQGGTHVYVNHNVAMSSGKYICVYIAADAGNAKGRYWYAEESFIQPRTFTTGSASTTGNSTDFVVTPRVEASSQVAIKVVAAAEWDGAVASGPAWINDGFALTDLDGVPIGPTTSSYLKDGISLVGREGYAYGSTDQWTLHTAGLRPKNATLPSVTPSPRNGWRSGTTGSTWTLKYTFDTVNGAAMRVGSPLFGIFLDGLHGVGNVVVKDNGVSVGTATLSHSVAMTRAGNAVYPTESGTNAQGAYVEHDELVGGMVDLGSGDVRRISGNSAGALQSGSTRDTKRAVIFLEDIDGSEAGSGTFSVYPPRALILVREHGNWRRLDLEINSSNPSPSTYREIGIVAAGPIHVAGFLNSRQTTLAFEDGTTLFTMDDGTRRSVERHPTRRRAEVSWTYSPIDVRQIRNAGTTAPDYVLAKTGGSTPAAMRQDTPLLVSALYAGINGKSQPIVWIPHIEVGSATMTTYLQARAGECLYGRVTGPIRRERAPQVGLPVQSEAFTVTTVTVEEEL